MKVYSFEDCVKNGIEFKSILHIGAHVGQEIKEYYDNGVEEVVWIDANKKIMDKLIENTSNYPIKQKYICEVLSDVHDEEVVFNITNGDEQASSILKLGTVSNHVEINIKEKVFVKTKRFDKIFEKYGIDIEKIDFINLDVQGAELKVLNGFGDLLNNKNIKGIFSEINFEEVYTGCVVLEDLDKFLENYGFKRIFMHRFVCPWGDALYLRD